MQPIKNFSIFKNEKKQDNHPDYKLSAKIGDDYREIGAGFIKDGNGNKYISVVLKKEFTKEDGTVLDGFVIITDKQFNAMKKVYDDYLIKKNNPDYPTPTDQGIDLDEMQAIMRGEKEPNVTVEDLDINVDDIPFP